MNVFLLQHSKNGDSSDIWSDGSLKRRKAQNQLEGLFAHLLLNDMLHTKTYLMLTGFGESHGTGMLRS